MYYELSFKNKLIRLKSNWGTVIGWWSGLDKVGFFCFVFASKTTFGAAVTTSDRDNNLAMIPKFWWYPIYKFTLVQNTVEYNLLKQSEVPYCFFSTFLKKGSGRNTCIYTSTIMCFVLLCFNNLLFSDYSEEI